MNFSYPWFLLLLIPIIFQLLVGILFNNSINVFPRAQKKVKENNYKYINFKNNDYIKYSFIFGVLCLALAAAGPQFGSKVKKVEE